MFVFRIIVALALAGFTASGQNVGVSTKAFPPVAPKIIPPPVKLPLPPKTLDCSKYPPIDKPVAAVPDFTAQVDLTGVPNLPLNKYNPDLDPCAQTKSDQCNAECGCYSSTDIHACSTPGVWAPTYDDGPSPFTPKVTATLKEHGDVKSTFFIVGSRLCSNAQEMLDALNAGHAVGVHTWSHTRLTTLTNEQIIAEIMWTEKAIIELTGIKPKYIRPPFGNMDDRVRFIIAQMGYIPIIWTDGADTNDWVFNFVTDTAAIESQGLSAIEGNLTSYINANKGSHPGTISLEHDIAQIPTNAASSVLDLIVKSGWKLTLLSTCLGSPSWSHNDLVGLLPYNGTSPTSPISSTSNPPIPTVTSTQFGNKTNLFPTATKNPQSNTDTSTTNNTASQGDRQSVFSAAEDIYRLSDFIFASVMVIFTTATSLISA